MILTETWKQNIWIRTQLENLNYEHNRIDLSTLSEHAHLVSLWFFYHLDREGDPGTFTMCAYAVEFLIQQQRIPGSSFAQPGHQDSTENISE